MQSLIIFGSIKSQPQKTSDWNCSFICSTNQEGDQLIDENRKFIPVFGNFFHLSCFPGQCSRKLFEVVVVPLEFEFPVLAYSPDTGLCGVFCSVFSGGCVCCVVGVCCILVGFVCCVVGFVVGVCCFVVGFVCRVMCCVVLCGVFWCCMVKSYYVGWRNEVSGFFS